MTKGRPSKRRSPGDRGRLPRSVLDWSLLSIEKHGDNNLFYLPFEFEVFRRNWSELAAELLDLRVDLYCWSPPRRLLLPRDQISFRRASQVDPLDSLILTALVKLAGHRIEARRKPRDVVFSSRFAKTGDSLYDTKHGWEQFWHHSWLAAEKVKYVAQTDLADFYNQVRHDEILGQLEVCGVPDRVCQAFAGFLRTYGGASGQGVPIGPHFSHLLAELALVRVDALLAARGLRFKRYVDDYNIFCADREEAQLALFDVADLLDAEFGLSLNRMKTRITGAREFVVEAKRRAREESHGELEDALLAAIRAVTDSDYDFASFDEIFDRYPEAVADETIEELLDKEISVPRVDYLKLGWLLRRLTQVAAPGGVAFILANFEQFVPVIGDAAHYLARAGKNWQAGWENLGGQIFEHADDAIVARSAYVQAMLFGLFAAQSRLDHLDSLLGRFPTASAAARRELVLAARAGGATDWLHHLRKQAADLDPWTRRAFIYSTSVLPPPQQEDCLRSIDAQAYSADSILLGALVAEREAIGSGSLREPSGPAWTTLLAQAPKARRELVEERFDALGDALESEIYGAVEKRGQERLLVATWNLRNLGGGVFGFSDRLPESLTYIARVLLAFDLVAIQEVQDTAPVDRLLTLLGTGWEKVVSGRAPGRDGNSERSAFLYRPGRVRFLGEVEQLVLGKRDLILGHDQFARPPFIVSFEVGEARVTACTAHTYFGATRGQKLERRIAEINTLAKLVVRRAKQEGSTAVLLGDLNIVGPNHATMAPLRRYELALAAQHLIPTNARGDKFYTQIAFKPTQDGPRLRRAGVFPVFDHVLRENDALHYRAEMESSSAWETSRRKRGPIDPCVFFENWRTFQLSDHFPVWVDFVV